MLGRPTIGRLTPAHYVALHSVARTVGDQAVVRYFNRIVHNGEIFHSSYYCKSFKRNSNTVVLTDLRLFSIETFVVADLNHDGSCCYAIGRCFTPVPLHKLCRNPVQNINLEHLTAVTKQQCPLIAVESAIIKLNVFLLVC